MWHDAIRYALLRVFYPCLMIFGTIGNILCLKILLRKRFRRQSTCQYLSILAVIDILFIYLRSARHFYQQFYKIDPRNTSLWMCRTLIFISSTLSHIASWILVVVSFDRYLIVKNRLSYRNAGWRVIKSTCCLICIVCLVNSHYFYILGKNIRSLFSSFSAKTKNCSFRYKQEISSSSASFRQKSFERNLSHHNSFRLHCSYRIRRILSLLHSHL